MSVEPQRLALLAFLALHPKRTASRDEIMRHLWPALHGEQARQALNQALFAISKALGDDAIFPSAKSVRLGTRVSVDALEFQSAADAGRAEDAKQLYTAPLLDGFELDDAPAFQQWAETQRARFSPDGTMQRPAAAALNEGLHDLAETEPTPEAAPADTRGTSEPEEPEPAADFGLLAEPEIQARVEQPSDALSGELRANELPDPELLAEAARVERENVVPASPAEPALMTNRVPEQESGARIPGSGTLERDNVVMPPPTPREDIPGAASEPKPTAIEGTAAARPSRAGPAPEAQQGVVVPGAPPARRASVENKPDEQRKRRRRTFPLPSARSVVTVLALLALGAVGYFLAPGWIRGGREEIAAVRDRARARAEAEQQARDRTRSIAVLPIEYRGHDQADAALAARIVKDLGPKLTRAGLLVIPSAALTGGGPPYDLRVIADSLRVPHILQGVMQREDSGPAFRFRLVNAADGTTRWDYTYRPRLADIPVLEEDVATTVVRRILQGSREHD